MCRKEVLYPGPSIHFLSLLFIPQILCVTPGINCDPYLRNIYIYFAFVSNSVVGCFCVVGSHLNNNKEQYRKMPLHAFISESENIVSLEYKCCQVFKLPFSSIYSELIFIEQVRIQFPDTKQSQNTKNIFTGKEEDFFSLRLVLLTRLLLVVEIYGQDTGYLQCYCEITLQCYHDLSCSLCKIPGGISPGGEIMPLFTVAF